MGSNYEEDIYMKKLTEEAKQEVRNNHLINLKKERKDNEQDESLK